MKRNFIHRTAEIGKNTKIGENTKIWHFAQIRENVQIGQNCIIGKNVYMDFGNIIGNNCKIENNCSIYHRTIIEDGVFIGPHVVITNDKFPRAIDPEGNLKSPEDWEAGMVVVSNGASIGAGSIILPNIKIGRFAVVGAGSIVSHDVPDFALVYGNPARVCGKVNKKGLVIKRF